MPQNAQNTRDASLIAITMSESGPVTIDPEHWAVVAQANRHDGVVKCQANTEWGIRVREHADGRRLVYGWQHAGYGGQYAGFRGKNAGYLLDRDAGEDATVRAIRRVAGVIEDKNLAAECIGDLPATVLR
jgi:hypothetical protein